MAYDRAQVVLPQHKLWQVGTLEENYIPGFEPLFPAGFKRHLHGVVVGAVADDVRLHVGCVPLADVVANGTSPVMPDQDELVPAESLGKVGNVVSQFVYRVVLQVGGLITFTIASIVNRYTPNITKDSMVETIIQVKNLNIVLTNNLWRNTALGASTKTKTLGIRVQRS